MDSPRLAAHPEGKPQGDGQADNQAGKDRTCPQAAPVKPEEEGGGKLHQQIELPVEKLQEGRMPEGNRQDDQDDDQRPRAGLANLRQALLTSPGSSAPIKIA